MKKKVLISICAVLITGFVILFYYYITSKDLTVSHYQLSLVINESIRIVQITDLHNTEFGENNCELIDLVKEQEPDLIFMSGDMLNRDDENMDIVMNLISSLSKTTPVYFGFGNHEYNWEKIWKRSIRYEAEAAGAVVVNNDYVDIDFKGSLLRIGGYMGYYRQPHMFNSNIYVKNKEIAFADDFENTDRIKLLINHIPTQWVDWHYINKYEINAVFCGHYHGGMIRIPFVDRGVFAPYIGWFPKYTKGMFTGDKATCILSAGLGTEHSVPRINNPPEITVVDLVPIE